MAALLGKVGTGSMNTNRAAEPASVGSALEFPEVGMAGNLTGFSPRR